MPINNRLFLAVAICAIAFAGSVSAATITQTCTIAVTGVPYTQTCTLNDFNPAGGTLNSVILSLFNVAGSVFAEQQNIGSSTLSFTNSSATIELSLTGPDSIDVTDTSSPCSGTVAGGTTGSCSPTSFSGLSTPKVTGITADYIGTGVITPAFEASGQI